MKQRSKDNSEQKLHEFSRKLFAEKCLFFAAATSIEHLPSPDLPEIAFAGRSNVGKSSLLNCLTGIKKLAFSSKTPGRTQLINFFIKENELMLVDLPGYGFAKAPKSVRQNWEHLITDYLFQRTELCLVLLLVDTRRSPMKTDLEVRGLLRDYSIPHAIIATKIDKLSKNRLQQQLQLLSKAYCPQTRLPLLAFSAVTNEGRNELWKLILTHTRQAKRARRMS